MATEEEKAALRQKLERIEILNKQLEDLHDAKKKLQEECEPARSLVQEGMNDFGARRLELSGGDCVVQKVKILHHRKPTMQLIYQAVENVLGSTEKHEINSEVQRRREIEKASEPKQCSVQMIKTGELRKVRKDKKVKDMNNKIEKLFVGKKTKLRFMPKTKKARGSL